MPTSMILLTGATGYLGLALVRALNRKKLRCLARNPAAVPSLRQLSCAVVAGDVTEPSSLPDAVKHCSVVIHGAALIRGAAADYQNVNVEGTRNLLAAAKAAKVKHFIFLSSILAAYPKLTPYGRSKLEAEALVKKSGIPYTILRISLVYKKDDDKTIGKIVSLVKKFPIIPLIGSGRGILQPVAIDDVASAVFTVASGKAGNIMHYIAGPPLTFKELLVILSRELGVRRFFVPVPLPLLKIGLRIYSLLTRQDVLIPSQLDALTSGQHFDYSSAERHLGFSPCSFAAGFVKYKKI